MNNDALVAALGMDAVAAVHGYRAAVISEATRRGLRLVSGSLSDVVQPAVGVYIVGPLDIRLTFRRGPGRADLDGRALQWSPEHGWSLCRPSTQLPVRYYAGPRAVPLQLVPTAPDVLDWAIADPDRPTSRCSALPPDGVALDDDPAALHRLIDFIDPHRRSHAYRAFRTPDRPPFAYTHPRRL
ncbi:hypothetical protein [Pseudonocardia sp. H11422]|uniref:hypothetical protein n=1 Tax=Pseudonocardia sp. H11422 TaxID=2835866 RepID=UPI001BDC1205|nr:hypothetical protein [Pseudonocardia sp. H11422]